MLFRLAVTSIIFSFFVACSMAANAELAVHIVGFHYPRLAHMAGLQGDVVIALTIGGDGGVKEAKVLSGNGLLAVPSVNTLRAWMFAPCGQKPGCTQVMNVRFLLQGTPRDISQCEDQFEFDNADQIIVTSQFARAIID